MAPQVNWRTEQGQRYGTTGLWKPKNSSVIAAIVVQRATECGKIEI
jgi:hypothetical protein